MNEFFNKAMMSDTGISMAREYLQVSTSGAYTAAAISGCNTRKYHGLLVAPQPQIDDEHHVFLSSLDETISCGNDRWNLDTHYYPGANPPDGYRFINEFTINPIPQWTYRFGNVILLKELLLCEKKNLLLSRYTLQSAPATVVLRLMPLLAFRVASTLSKASTTVDGNARQVRDGICIKLYPGYSPLYMQSSAGATFVAAADWYYNILYEEERCRGYDSSEDLFTPGYFEVKLLPGDSFVLASGFEELECDDYGDLFQDTLQAKPVAYTAKDHLVQAARQFMIDRPDGTYIKAGYYWFGRWGRDTCIALPGLTLYRGDTKLFEQVVDTLLLELKEGLLPNTGFGQNTVYNTADASLWLIWALQQYAKQLDTGEIWMRYGSHLKSILEHYKNGTSFGIKMDTDGLIRAGLPGFCVTWMDACNDNKPVTPRIGKTVELNALWYNAVCFCIQQAREAGDIAFVEDWKALPGSIEDSFMKTFWEDDKEYLADYTDDHGKNWSLRPNQVFAVSLPFSPIPSSCQKAVVDKLAEELLTPRGLRTLSAEDPGYRGHYNGDQAARDLSYHQGTVWPWLLGHFSEAYLKVYEELALPLLKSILAGMMDAMEEYCLYTIPEIYDGDYPYKPGGAVAQAWSVAELIRMDHMINLYSERYKAALIKK